MAIHATDPTLGETPCQTDQESWRCPNMREIDGDLSMRYERYRCEKCGRRVSLDYDEMT